MKALYIDQVSANPESLQKKGHQTIKGADIFEWNLLSALLEYGTYDAYFARGLTEEKKQALLHGGLPQDSIKLRLLEDSYPSKILTMWSS